MSISSTKDPPITTTDTWQRVMMPEADVSLLLAAPLTVPRDQLFAKLHTTLPWRAETITMFGRSVMQPRLVCWFGDENCIYTYSGTTMTPQPWTPALQELRHDVQALTGARFNSVLANLYRHERDSMGFHSDDEPELGKNPIIASLSLGAQRMLIFKHRRRKPHPPVRVPLPAGSLLLMKGETQNQWHHGINKQTQPCGPRINLTFRWVHV
jgi:alkylated DNA repair dioxygenase AlkB